MRRGLVILIIMAASLPGLSQEEEDSIQVREYRNGISFYFDYGKLTSLIAQQNTKWEGGAAVFFRKRWRVAGEYGYGSLEPQQVYEDGSYKSEGTYFRVGLDYIMSVDAKSNLSIGFRYGASNFEDSGYNPSDTLNPTFSRQDLKADWYEAVIESEAEFWAGVFLGLKIRLRFMNTYTSFPENDVYSVPGYGRTFDNSIPALNLFVKYKIGF